MGDAEQPPGSVPETEEITARAAASPQLVAITAGAAMEPWAMEPWAMEPSATEKNLSVEAISGDATTSTSPRDARPESESAGDSTIAEPVADAPASSSHDQAPSSAFGPEAGSLSRTTGAFEEGPRDSGWASARPPTAVAEGAAAEPAALVAMPETPALAQTAPIADAAADSLDPQSAELQPSEAQAPVPEPPVPQVALNIEEVPSVDEFMPPPPPEPGSLAATLMGERARAQDTAEPSSEEDESVPPPGMHLHSKPPPKPAGYVSERPHSAEVSAQPRPVQTSAPPAAMPISRPAPATDLKADTAFSNQLRKSRLNVAVWVIAIGVAGFVGWAAAGAANERKLQAAAAAASTAVRVAREAAIAETKAAIPPMPAYLDLSQPAGVRPIIDIVKTEPGKRTRAEAVALGRQWQAKRFDEYNRFSAELHSSPQKLDDSKARTQALEFVHDRSTSRVMLELLSELPSPRALDILYEVWIGSKERNETTQLAEALLLSKDVRKRASGALDMALVLRDKPTDCGEIQRLVEQAIREGDRRSSNQLVTMAARQNCGSSGDKDCVTCLGDPKDMRKAIRATAARPEPVQ